MKKFLFLTLLMSIFCTGSAFAQQIVCEAPGITVNFKKITMQGNTATIQFTIANDTGKDLHPIMLGKYGLEKTEAFDNKGNYYDMSSISIDIANATLSGSIYSSVSFSLPNGIVQKGAITIEEVDPNATSFTKINISLYGFNISVKPYGEGPIAFKNVPIPKN